VHNIRIERLWCDVTAGFGGKWRKFFYDLELRDGLDVNLSTHLWLLQHLYLPEINNDANTWAGAWNNHKISTRGIQRSPRDMFVIGMLEEGLRGVEVAPMTDDIIGYGVDWDALNDTRIRDHHDNANGEPNLDMDDDTAFNPFLSQAAPDEFSEVVVDEPNCPLTREQVANLDTQLANHVSFQSRSLESYRLRWITALNLCIQMFVL
jgi:hypothetical protein